MYRTLSISVAYTGNNGNVSRIAGRLLLQHTLAATQCLTTYSTTSSHGYHWPNVYVNIAVPWYLYYFANVSNAIPWQLQLHYGELITYEHRMLPTLQSRVKAEWRVTARYMREEKSCANEDRETSVIGKELYK